MRRSDDRISQLKTTDIVVAEVDYVDRKLVSVKPCQLSSATGMVVIDVDDADPFVGVPGAAVPGLTKC